MLKKITNTTFIILFLFSIFFITKRYFSENNVMLTNKLRSTYSLIVKEENSDLPVLENDTDDIIVYKTDIEDFKKKRKKRFWENLISNFDE